MGLSSIFMYTAKASPGIPPFSTPTPTQSYQSTPIFKALGGKETECKNWLVIGACLHLAPGALERKEKQIPWICLNRQSDQQADL